MTAVSNSRLLPKLNLDFFLFNVSKNLNVRNPLHDRDCKEGGYSSERSACTSIRYTRVEVQKTL